MVESQACQQTPLLRARGRVSVLLLDSQSRNTHGMMLLGAINTWISPVVSKARSPWSPSPIKKNISSQNMPRVGEVDVMFGRREGQPSLLVSFFARVESRSGETAGETNNVCE